MVELNKKIKCEFIFKNGWWLLVIIAFLVICFSEKKFDDKILNISYSIVAAGIFYFIDVYLLTKRKKKLYRNVINHQLFIVVESLRLCREVIVRYNLNNITKGDFVKHFLEFDLNEKMDDISELTVLEYINTKKEITRSMITSLLCCHEYLELKEYDTLIKIIDSPFFKEDLIAKNYNLPESMQKYDYNNQQRFGESIYDNYEFAKILYNHENI